MQLSDSCYVNYFQVVSIGSSHTCASTSQVRGKEASKAWIADRAMEILNSTSALGAKNCNLSLKDNSRSKCHILRCGKEVNLH